MTRRSAGLPGQGRRALSGSTGLCRTLPGSAGRRLCSAQRYLVSCMCNWEWRHTGPVPAGAAGIARSGSPAASCCPRRMRCSPGQSGRQKGANPFGQSIGHCTARPDNAGVESDFGVCTGVRGESVLGTSLQTSETFPKLFRKLNLLLILMIAACCCLSNNTQSALCSAGWSKSRARSTYMPAQA